MPSDEVRRLLKLFGVAMTEFEDAVHQGATNEKSRLEVSIGMLLT